MKNTKHRMLFIILLAISLAITGCGSSGNDNPPDSGSIVITDSSGAEIKLDAPATRIVALTAANCEIIYALGAEASLIGRGEYCDYPAEILDIPAVQSGSNTNIEQIMALEPQIVIMSMMDQTEEQISALKNAGIKVIVSDAQNIEDVYTSIELIGKVVGKDQQATQLIDDMQKEFSEITAKIKDAGDKTVYFEVSPLEYGLWTAGSNTFMDELSQMLGVNNIFADVSDWGEISQEQVIERDPDFIVTVTMYFGEGPKPEDEIMARKGWQDITAIKNGAVLVADSDAITRPGPRLTEAAKGLYNFFYE